MDCQGVRRDDVALLREGAQIDRSSLAQKQVDHSTASLADEMIVLAGLGIESGSLCVQKEGADLTLVDETVEVAVNGGETDPRQFFVNPLVDLMGERVSVIALESFEHLRQLACRTFAGGPPHRLTSRFWLPGGSDRTVNRRDYQIDGSLSSDSPGDPVSSGGVARPPRAQNSAAARSLENLGIAFPDLFCVIACLVSSHTTAFRRSVIGRAVMGRAMPCPFCTNGTNIQRPSADFPYPRYRLLPSTTPM